MRCMRCMPPMHLQRFTLTKHQPSSQLTNQLIGKEDTREYSCALFTFRCEVCCMNIIFYSFLYHKNIPTPVCMVCAYIIKEYKSSSLNH